MICYALYFLAGDLLLFGMMMRCGRTRTRWHERDAAAEALDDLKRVCPAMEVWV